MRKSIKKNLRWSGIIGLVVAMLLVPLLVACQGPPGEKGPAGPAGTAGPAGPPGPAAVTEEAPATEALEVEAEFPYGKVRAVGFRTEDNQVYPDEKVWITLHEGEYAYHDNEQIVTTGLNSVGVGTYVYLEGKEADTHEAPITAWSWKVVGPLEADIEVEGAETRQPHFLANAEGKYEVTITATLEDGTKASSEFPVYAGRYIGAEECALCHSDSVMPDKVTAWRETGHGTKFETSFARYSGASDYCIGCHVTGYNEADNAGGFDDAARQAGWDPAEGSVGAWIEGEGLTLQDVMESPAGKFANIQCESCHGPGSVHTKALSYEPGVCSQCHPQEAQWRFSGHATGATGSSYMHTAESTGCAYCHTGEGFVEYKVRHNELVFPNMATADKPANLPEPGAMSPIACATCHDPHAATEPHNKGTAEAPNIASLQLRLAGEVTMYNGETVNAHESAACVSCHANKRDLAYKAAYLAGENSRGPHSNTQADNFYGVTAAAFDFGQGAYASSPHSALAEEGCIHCHMAPNPVMAPGPDGEMGTRDDVKALTAGDHTWSMAGEYEGELIENTGACMTEGCHAEGSITDFNRKAFGDYDGDGAVEGIGDELQGLIEIVEGALPKNADGNLFASGFNTADLTDVQLQAYWNYNLVSGDGSGGVHNTAYSIQVLQRTYKQLTGSDVPGATLR